MLLVGTHARPSAHTEALSNMHCKNLYTVLNFPLVIILPIAWGGELLLMSTHAMNR